MDTSGYYPQLSDDDPLFEIAQYTQIMKQQLDKQIRHAEFTAAASSYPASSGAWGPGAFTLDAVSTVNNTFVQADTNDSVKVLETGLYLISWTINFSGAPVNGEVVIKNETTGRFYYGGDFMSFSWGPTHTTQAYVFANNIVKFYTVNRGGAVTTASRLQLTKLQGVS
jgi:hypothetical protein